MSVAPPLAGSTLAFALGVAVNIVTYCKHRRRRIIDLLDDFVELKGEVDGLLARWEDINEEIEHQSATIEKNKQHTSLGMKVLRVKYNFEKIELQYGKLCKDLESKVRSASGLKAGNEVRGSQKTEDENQAAVNENQNFQEAENENQVDIGRQKIWTCNFFRKLCKDLESKVRSASGLKAGNEVQGSQKTEDENQAAVNENQNSQEAENENQADIGRQKIWTRNFFRLGRLDKDVVKLTPKVTAVTKELVLGDLTRQAKPKIVERMRAEKLGNILPSHQKHLDDLLQYVMKQNCKRIGIIGATAVGKTNILKNLNNCFDSSSPTYCGSSVGYVIWVPVPKENNEETLIQTIQEEIIERLKLTSGKTRSRKTDIISSFLSKEKYLLLLDDFSPLVKLEDVGIQEEHKHGKVVMAAKDSHALKNVQLDETIEIKSLSLPDAHKLFKHFIKDYDDLLPEQKNMVYPILKALGGLPEFIKLIAKYLNDHRQFLDWKGIKEGSQSDVRIPKLLGMAPTIESYKKAYEDLAQNYIQKCLLYAALFPSRYKICRNTLVECWKAENFLDCRPPTLNAARAAGTLVFNRLSSSCLLENCDERYVKMPVFFRKVAFDISFPGEGDGALCVRSGSDKDGHLEEKDWNNARRVSLIRNNLESESLPIRPRCDGISTLLLQHNPGLKLITDGFFINMRGLRVLNLHSTGITDLPSSISDLKALRSLYLNDCGDLNKLPTTITMLQELEVLDIRGTSIPCLPAEILNLVSLRCLRISFAVGKSNLDTGFKEWKIVKMFKFFFTESWEILPPDAHIKLSNLEEMTIDLKGEVSDQVRDIIRKEAVEFIIRNGFQFELGPYPGQSFGSYSQASEVETGELSNVVEGPARSPSNVDERSAGNAPSTAVVLQNNNNQKELMETKAKNSELEMRIKKLEAAVFKMGASVVELEENDSCLVKHDPSPNVDEIKSTKKESTDKYSDDEDLIFVDTVDAFQGKPVALTLEPGTKVAAYGTVVPTDEEKEQLHGTPLPNNYVRVVVDHATDGSAPLPVPIPGLCACIADAIGTQVAWPIHLIKMQSQPKKKNARGKKEPSLESSSMPRLLHMLYYYYKVVFNDEKGLQLNVPYDIFGKDYLINVYIDDITHFCQLKPISYNCIVVYICYLYKKLTTENKLEKFRFVDPYSLGYIHGERHEKLWVQEQMEKRSRLLADRLIGTSIGQLVLVPVNLGFHWILTVIDPYNEDVYLLDPLHLRNRDEEWKLVVNLAIKLFNVEKQKSGKKQPLWEVMKPPLQPDENQCGYFVMQYMRQIIEEYTLGANAPLQSIFTKNEYSREEIDEVRKEWSEYLQDHILVEQTNADRRLDTSAGEGTSAAH